MKKIQVIDKNGKEWEFEEIAARYRKSVYGLAVYKNQVLLIMDPRSGRWELPGGGVDPGENDEQGLIREIKEETGLEADTSEMKLIQRVQGYYKSLDHDFPWKTDRSYFIISIKNPDGPILKTGNGDDVEQCQWVEIDNLDSLEMAEVDYEVIKKVVNI